MNEKMIKKKVYKLLRNPQRPINTDVAGFCQHSFLKSANFLLTFKFAKYNISIRICSLTLQNKTRNYIEKEKECFK